MTGTVSKQLCKFFNSMAENIIVDENPAFRSIYENFDLNYAFDHSMLDVIVQKELDAALHVLTMNLVKFEIVLLMLRMNKFWFY
ncbi:hypothetical protein [Spiroplasma poulsonii]|uniref:hypothetical protein n=1 Tax=Spiroplasma poulsonii TaxID=2138 RepID=UPI001F4D14EF|nr:hypothetical protein [Spiroplasma poulsonii]UNF61242.1 hypothetical protein MNU24_04825 [Spiroplasma poulsonii]